MKRVKKSTPVAAVCIEPVLSAAKEDIPASRFHALVVENEKKRPRKAKEAKEAKASARVPTPVPEPPLKLEPEPESEPESDSETESETDLELKPAPASAAPLAAVTDIDAAAMRKALHAACLQPYQAAWTHQDMDGEHYFLTPEQEKAELRLFCMAYLAPCGESEELLIPRVEEVSARVKRVDAALAAFLASPHVVHAPKARVSHKAFGVALKRFAGPTLRGVSQHAIAQACRRADLKLRCSHETRFWVDLTLASNLPSAPAVDAVEVGPEVS